MATSTFERKIAITTPDSIKKLVDVTAMDVLKKPLSEHPFTDADRKKSNDLLKRCSLRSRN